MYPTPVKTEVLFEPFPKQQQFIDAALSCQYRFILFGGAIRGGKTISILGLFLLLCRVFPGSRWVVVRKNLPTIKRNLLPSFEKVRPTTWTKSFPKDTYTWTGKNGSQILFFPENYNQDKELLRWRGLEANGFGYEEINECQQPSLEKGFERAGSYVIPGLEIQPFPLVVASCNPTQGWVKKLVYKPFKEGTLRDDFLYIQSRIYDNEPLLKAQPNYLPNLKATMTRYAFQVFVEGNWDVQLKTGGEFLRDFEIEKHVMPVDFDPRHMLQISIDANAYPFISFTIWQFIEHPGGWIIRQIGECTPEDPNNTANRATQMLANYLHDEYEYTDKLGLYGDRSTKNRNVINDDHSSFFDLVQQKLRENKFRIWDRMWKAPPPVHTMGDFVNAVFRGDVPGLTIEIGEHCDKSINDYIGAKTNNDGGILKQEIPHPTIANLKYQEFGHLTDTLKDIVCQAFFKEFEQWRNRFQQLIPGGIQTIARNDNITF